MDETKLNSIKIDGAGTYAGGVFDRISIFGSGKITGDTTCNNINISGDGKIMGNLTCDVINISGQGKIQGDTTAKDATIAGVGKFDKKFTADNMNVTGMAKCYQDVKAKKVIVNGVLDIENNMKADTVEGHGCLSVEKEMIAENINIHGLLKCKEFLNCESLRLSLVGTSTIKEIGGSNIYVKEMREVSSFFTKLFAPKQYKDSKLVTDLIEGDDIYLENTVAGVVRGNKVKIGKNCEIESVEYEDSIEIDTTSVVKEENKVGGI